MTGFKSGFLHFNRHFKHVLSKGQEELLISLIHLNSG